MIDIGLATLSNTLFNVVVTYPVAMVAYFFRLAFTALPWGGRLDIAANA